MILDLWKMRLSVNKALCSVAFGSDGQLLCGRCGQWHSDLTRPWCLACICSAPEVDLLGMRFECLTGDGVVFGILESCFPGLMPEREDGLAPQRLAVGSNRPTNKVPDLVRSSYSFSGA